MARAPDDQTASAELLLCAACSPFAADAAKTEWAEALRVAGLAGRVRFRLQVCLNACGSPSAAALHGKDRATYLFAGLNPATDTADVIETVKLYLDAPQGWIADARGCGRLRHCLRGRIPAFETEPPC